MGRIALERLEQRAAEQELAAEQLARVCARLGGADGQQLALVVPVVDRVVEVDPLVALQPDQPRALRVRERAGDLGLAHARLALEQQRLLERGGQVHARGERPVREVALAGERVGDVLGRAELHVQHCDA